MIVSGFVAHYTRIDLPSEGLYAVKIERPNHASVVAYRAGTEWQSTDCEVVYGCDSTLIVAPGEVLIYRGEVLSLGSTLYVHLREEGVLDRIDGDEELLGGFNNRLNDALYRRLRGVGLSAECESVVATMVLSRGDNLSRSLRDSYRESGTAHLLAVSGLHASIVALLLFGLLTPLTLLYRGNILRIGAVIVGLWLFACANFMGASVVRAAIMYTLFLVGNTMRRYYDSTTALSLAVVVMCVYDPTTLFDIGFQLSSIAVLSIIHWAVPLWRGRPRWMQGLWCEFTLQPMLITLCCSVATAPIVAYNFGDLQLLGFLVAPLVYATSFLTLLLSMVTLAIGSTPLNYPLEWVVALQNRVVEWLASASPEGGSSALSLSGVVLIYLLYGAVTIYVIENYKDK
ncbi:MAG: ComEC/Rec2 family competence protein [Rikenellaceae bacterium]